MKSGEKPKQGSLHAERGSLLEKFHRRFPLRSGRPGIWGFHPWTGRDRVSWSLASHPSADFFPEVDFGILAFWCSGVRGVTQAPSERPNCGFATADCKRNDEPVSRRKLRRWLMGAFFRIDGRSNRVDRGRGPGAWFPLTDVPDPRSANSRNASAQTSRLLSGGCFVSCGLLRGRPRGCRPRTSDEEMSEAGQEKVRQREARVGRVQLVGPT